jgi:AraC family transcriptional regulator, regulatory protein of adaptative response / DNA-3-methyladenine glycosylase II
MAENSDVLAYRPPFATEALFSFFAAHTLPGVEVADHRSWRRTVALDHYTGWVCVTHEPEQMQLRIEWSQSLGPKVSEIFVRIQRVFDLAANPAVIDVALSKDLLLAELVQGTPGLRLPGSFVPFETAVRAILGQQVSVKAANTMTARLANALGQSIRTPFSDLTHLFPTRSRLAEASLEELTSLGIITARARTIQNIARSELQFDSELIFDGDQSPNQMIASLVKIPGIGPWTAQYIAMRGYSWPDAFLAGDLIVKRALGSCTEKEAEQRAEAWRPWRAYAALHLWRSQN